MGGAALHFGWVAEMKTGEGKTLVSTLPAYLNGARRQGRPPRHRQRLPRPLPRRVDGPRSTASSASSVGLIIPGFKDVARPRSASSTRADITYGTNNEFGFDYLRDNMAGAPRRQDPARPQLRDRRRGRLDPHRRGPHAADHLRPCRRRRQAVLPLRLDRPLAAARRRLRGRGGQARRRPARGRHRQGRGGARHREPLRRGAAEPRPPVAGRARRPRSCTSGTRTTSSRTAR